MNSSDINRITPTIPAVSRPPTAEPVNVPVPQQENTLSRSTLLASQKASSGPSNEVSTPSKVEDVTSALNSNKLNEDDSEKQAQKLSEGDIEKAVADINDAVQNLSRTLKFSVGEESGRIIIEVRDSETKELIRKIPPEDALDMIDQMEEHRDGMFIKAKV